MAEMQQNHQVAQALVDFSLHRSFPEEDEISSHHIAVQDLAAALELLAAAKSKLESDIHTINEETAPDVNQWLTNAQSLDADINHSRSLANELVRRSEAPDLSGRAIQEAQLQVDFLEREASYNIQLGQALASIKNVSRLLDQVEQARDERRIADSLRLLQQARSALDDVCVSKSCRVMKLLDLRASGLKSNVHDVLDHVWSSLVRVDAEHASVAILKHLPDEQMTLSDALSGLDAYGEVQQRMTRLWHSLDAAVISPRTDMKSANMPGIATDGHTLSLHGNAARNVTSLLSDLKKVMEYLSERLPDELVESLSKEMMPDLVARIVTVWLDSAIPSTLDGMDGFGDIVRAVQDFCDTLRALRYAAFDELQEWVDDLPRVWLSKCRQTALDSVRFRLAEGIGISKQVERVETQTVSRSEGQELAATNGVSPDDAWESAWSDEEDQSQKQKTTVEDDSADNWGWGDDGADADPEPDAAKASSLVKDIPAFAEEDSLDAWGWGDDDSTEAPPVQATSKVEAAIKKTEAPQTRELTLKETYHISSMPDPVLALISTILEDAASLVDKTESPVASAAPGLFSLPTLILALFRAVSPHYYAQDDGGNMFLYNDANYLAEKLSGLVSSWKARPDLPRRAITMLRLDNDIKTLRSFAERHYGTEMSTQRTILYDQLGGSQNLLQQDGADQADLDAQVDHAISRVRAVAATWSEILARSAWSQAVGSLVDVIAAKFIADVKDLSSIGQDESYNIASLIARVEQLDDLFPGPGTGSGDSAVAVPLTSQYAANWLRLKFLSEFLQSNLPEVLYLWNESDLSLEFSAPEVVELVRLSFMDNARTKDVIHKIESNPRPRGLM